MQAHTEERLNYDADFAVQYGMDEIVGRVKRMRDQLLDKARNIDRFLEQYVVTTETVKDEPVYYKGKVVEGQTRKATYVKNALRAGSLPMGPQDFTSRVEWLMNDVEWLTSNLGMAALARELARYNFGATFHDIVRKEAQQK